MAFVAMKDDFADSSAESSDSSESEDAAQDILDAIASSDAKALDMALTRHYELCESPSKPAEKAETEEG